MEQDRSYIIVGYMISAFSGAFVGFVVGAIVF
jgi:hypothetical protein